MCLSATVSNADELGEWLRTVRGPTDVVVEETRPVALEHLYAVTDKHERRVRVVPTLVRGRPNEEGAAFDVDDPRRGGRNDGRRRRRRRWATPWKTELVDALAERDLLPTIVFVFSRAGCEEAVRRVVGEGLRLTTDDEARAIRAIARRHVDGLDATDLAALEFARWSRSLESGVAAHHAGMVPPFKEAVEEAFAAGLLKVVFATETLALGINMPARSVVVDSLSKFTGETHELLTPAQYAQITGRAGRRGIDTEGTAIVSWSPFVPFDVAASLAASREFALSSSFRPTYNMAVNLVRRADREGARHLINLSFAQFQTDRTVVDIEQRLTERRADRDKARLKGKDRRVDRIDKQIRRLERDARTQTHALVHQFDRIVDVLEGRGFVDGWTLTAAGEQLAGIYHEADLLVATVLADGLFDDLDAPSLAALVSCLTHEHRSPDPPPSPWFPTAELRHRWRRLFRAAEDLRDEEEQVGIRPTRPPDAGFAGLAYDWCRGDDLQSVLDDDLSAGDFVRNIRVLLDLLRQIETQAGSAVTGAVARDAVRRIDRGLVAASNRVAA